MIVILSMCVLLDIAVLLRLLYAFRLTRVHPARIIEADLPSVTICIPARNETHAMADCLERVIESDYPKLEILVLDDGSRDDTSLLIKSFAHAGVRFIEGKPLPDGWLGKNYAQKTLAQQASGKYVFFIDVDTRMERYTVQRLVNEMVQSKSTMVSVVPIRNDSWQFSTILATMRHFWTIIRFRRHKPRAASNAWIIERQVLLDELRSDPQLPLSMQVETTIAQKLAESGSYKLALSNTWLGLRYEKKWSSQIETSTRLLYPQCEKKITKAALTTVLLLVFLIPYVAVLWNLTFVAIIVFQFGITYYYLSHVLARYRIIGALIVPLTVIQEIALLITSVYKYSFGTITWKGRPITAKHIT